MNQIYCKARAKINLTLDVLNKREDGYHNIKSIFQIINIYDELYITKRNDETIFIKTNISELDNENNIIYKAYHKLKEKYSNISGVDVNINKRIPIQAGLGGGSSDCASFLLCMNKLFDLNITDKEMKKIGASLGADVVPFLCDRTMLVEGIGEKVTSVKNKLKYYILIIKPILSCSTPKMYKALDEKRMYGKENDYTQNVLLAIKNNNLDMLSNNLYNVFEDVVDDKDVIKSLKSDLISHNALGSLMSGSGSSVFGIFDSKEKLKIAYEKLKNKYPTYEIVMTLGA